MKLLLPIERRLKAAALLGEDVQEHRAILSFEKLESLDQQRQIVAIDGAEVLQAEFLKEDRGPEHALGGLFSAAHDFHGGFAAEALDEARAESWQMLVVLVGDDAVEVAGDGAHVAIDGPLVVVEHDDQALGLLGDVVERFERDAVGESGVAGNGDHVLFAAGQIAGHRHAEGRGKRGTGVAGAVAIVLALGAEHEAVQAAGLANGVEAIEAAGKNFVDVGLVAYVEEESVFGSVKDSVEGQRQLDDAEIRAEMTAGFGERLDEECADLLRQFDHLRGIESL